MSHHHPSSETSVRRLSATLTAATAEGCNENERQAITELRAALETLNRLEQDVSNLFDQERPSPKPALTPEKGNMRFIM